jgi:hypothetical protein
VLFRDNGTGQATGLTPRLIKVYDTVKDSPPVAATGGGIAEDLGVDLSGYSRVQAHVSEDGGRTTRVAGWVPGAAPDPGHVLALNRLGWAKTTSRGDIWIEDRDVEEGLSFAERHDAWATSRPQNEIATAGVMRDARAELDILERDERDSRASKSSAFSPTKARFAEAYAIEHGISPEFFAAFDRATEGDVRPELRERAPGEAALSFLIQQQWAGQTLAKRIAREAPHITEAHSFEERLKQALEAGSARRRGPVMKKEPFRPTVNAKLAYLLGSV